MKGENFPLMQI